MTSRKRAEGISTTSWYVGPRIWERVHMSQPQHATTALSSDHVWNTPAECNPTPAYRERNANEPRLSGTASRVIPENNPCQLNCFSPLPSFCVRLPSCHTWCFEERRRHFLPSSQTKERLRWRPLHNYVRGVICLFDGKDAIG